VTDRRRAERKVTFARIWARAKQIVTTDPTGSDEDDRMVDDAAAEALAAEAGKLKGGLAKVAQLAAYDPGVSLGRRRGATQSARAVLGALWDRAPGISASAVARVVEQDLGKPPQQLFARWDATPIAAASLGQVHAATLHAGDEVVVKVQYPGVAEALEADLDETGFVRRLAGSELGATLDDEALSVLAAAVRGELDYRAEADAQMRFATAWAGDPVLRFPRVIPELSTRRVLTMTRAHGKTVVDTASARPELRREAALAIFRFAWGSPLAHGLLNADPNPGNFLVADGEPATVWCLDFGCAMELTKGAWDADRELHYGLLDSDGAERFRMALAQGGLLRRADTLATTAHRDWERALAMPFASHGDFHWTPAYASELADATGRVLAAGGVGLPATALLLWRQRLGAASVIAMLDAHAPFRRVLVDLIGTGKRALR
jgi:predicted unusual protein kinase regulating ubiquinone biosynthesis (AarF/ABC1/UbiB family)